MLWFIVNLTINTFKEKNEQKNKHTNKETRVPHVLPMLTHTMTEIVFGKLVFVFSRVFEKDLEIMYVV